MLNPSKNVKALLGTLSAILCLECATQITPGEYFIYNHTPSIPTGIYLELPKDRLETGDIVGFDPPEKIHSLAIEKGWIPENATMMKEIGATEGQSYERTDNNAFYANGSYIGQVIEQDSAGDKMPVIPQGKHIVPKGHILLISRNPYAFDGRYFGTIPKESIRFRAVRIFPFWTE